MGRLVLNRLVLSTIAHFVLGIAGRKLVWSSFVLKYSCVFLSIFIEVRTNVLVISPGAFLK